jgi:hypothetical protein
MALGVAIEKLVNYPKRQLIEPAGLLGPQLENGFGVVREYRFFWAQSDLLLVADDQKSDIVPKP